MIEVRPADLDQPCGVCDSRETMYAVMREGELLFALCRECWLAGRDAAILRAQEQQREHLRLANRFAAAADVIEDVVPGDWYGDGEWGL